MCALYIYIYVCALYIYMCVCVHYIYIYNTHIHIHTFFQSQLLNIYQLSLFVDDSYLLKKKPNCIIKAKILMEIFLN